jgi:hypothetical protein
MGLDIRVKLSMPMPSGIRQRAMSNAIKVRCLGGAQLCGRFDVLPVSTAAQCHTEHGSHPNLLQTPSQNTVHLLSIFRIVREHTYIHSDLFWRPRLYPKQTRVYETARRKKKKTPSEWSLSALLGNRPYSNLRSTTRPRIS